MSRDITSELNTEHRNATRRWQVSEWGTGIGKVALDVLILEGFDTKVMWPLSFLWINATDEYSH